MVIERSYDKEALEKEFQVKDYAVGLKGGRKEIRNLKRDASRGNPASTLFTTAEGIVLGLLGIGLPDIVIWVGVLLRGVYETAMKYGFSYETPEEKIFILKMLETAMATGEEWEKANKEVRNCRRSHESCVLSKNSVICTIKIQEKVSGAKIKKWTRRLKGRKGGGRRETAGKI